MASVMIGRSNCPECGFTGAHVKKSEKCTYRYCPECGAQHHARTPRQLADLAAKTRPLEGTPSPSPTPQAPAAAPDQAATLTPSPTPTQGSDTPKPKRSPLFGL